MLDLVLLFVPFFALVLMGWTAARARWLPLEGIGGMNTFVLFFGLSAMVFRLAAGGSLRQGGLGGLLLAYGLGGLTIAGLALVWCSRGRLSRRDSGLAALATAFPNTGFLGLPLLTGLLGASAAGPVAATLLIDVLCLSSVCLAWAHTGGREAQSQNAWPLFRGALRNPLLWSLGMGLLASWAGWTLPHALDEVVRLLSLSAAPVALFTLGAMLARAQMVASSAEPVPAPGQRVTVWVPWLLKLAVHPALVWGIGQDLRLAGMTIAESGLMALTMAAALPSASNVSMLAEREGADTALVARIILWTTVGALVTLTWWAHSLGVRAV